MSTLENKVAAALTEALCADRVVAQLINTRLPASDSFMGLDAPWVVSAENKTIGPLGLINGVLSMAGANRIAGHYDENGNLTGFWPCDSEGKPIPRDD
jgi:hypothetical protein